MMLVFGFASVAICSLRRVIKDSFSAMMIITRESMLFVATIRFEQQGFDCLNTSPQKLHKFISKWKTLQVPDNQNLFKLFRNFFTAVSSSKNREQRPVVTRFPHFISFFPSVPLPTIIIIVNFLRSFQPFFGHVIHIVDLYPSRYRSQNK